MPDKTISHEPERRRYELRLDDRVVGIADYVEEKGCSFTHTVVQPQHMIGEIASTEQVGSKAQWITGMLRALPTRYPKFRALVWFDKFEKRHGLADRDPPERDRGVRGGHQRSAVFRGRG